MKIFLRKDNVITNPKIKNKAVKIIIGMIALLVLTFVIVLVCIDSFVFFYDSQFNSA